LKDLENKSVLITGANRGIGFELVKHFSSLKCNIICCTREVNDEFLKKIEEIKLKNKVKIDNYILDLANFDSIKSSFKKISSEQEKIDILINNAGILYNALFLMTTLPQIENTFRINVISQIYLTQLVTKKMMSKKTGNIIFFSSSSAKENNFGRSLYSSSKSAIESLTKSISKELGVYNIRVNAIAPGPVNTEMFEKNTKEENIDKILKRTALKKIATTSDIANLASFLASNISSHINGEIISINGGLSIDE
jgi:3-oxoacyl-[acyl-carrier protein] reductase